MNKRINKSYKAAIVVASFVATFLLGWYTHTIHTRKYIDGNKQNPNIETNFATESNILENNSNLWMPHTSKILPLSYKIFPAGYMDLNNNDNDSIIGPYVILKNSEWPRIGIETRDSEFYNPPANVNLKDWVLKHVVLRKNTVVNKNTAISGIEAVHLTYKPNKPAPESSEEYYLVYKGKMYTIQFGHYAENELEKAVYKEFLDSITFNP